MFRHTGDVVSQRSGLLCGFGGVEPKKLGEGLTILRVLVDAKLDVLAECCVEFVELLTILGDLVEELKGLLDDVLLDDLHDLVLLEGFTRQVQREIFGVDNTLDEAEPFWDEICGIIGDEDASDIELDVVLGLLCLEQIKRCTLWHEEDGAELKLTLNGEMLNGQVVFPVTTIILANGVR